MALASYPVEPGYEASMASARDLPKVTCHLSKGLPDLRRDLWTKIHKKLSKFIPRPHCFFDLTLRVDGPHLTPAIDAKGEYQSVNVKFCFTPESKKRLNANNANFIGTVSGEPKTFQPNSIEKIIHEYFSDKRWKNYRVSYEMSEGLCDYCKHHVCSSSCRVSCDSKYSSLEIETVSLETKTVSLETEAVVLITEKEEEMQETLLACSQEK